LVHAQCGVAFLFTFLERLHRERFAQDMPLCLRNEGGSIWLRRNELTRSRLRGRFGR
jgi:hypothetical protein